MTASRREATATWPQGAVRREHAVTSATSERLLRPVFTAFDPALPSRDALLDDRFMRQWFTQHLALNGASVEAVVRVRVKYRPGENLRVLHRLTVDGQTQLVSSRMRSEGVESLQSESQPAMPSGSPLRSGVIGRDLSCAFWTFPHDRRLDVATAVAPVGRHCAAAFSGCELRFDVAGYAPERAVVFRVSGKHSGRPLAFAKLFASGGALGSVAVLTALARANRDSDAPVRVPKLLAEDEAGDWTLTEALDGVHLHDIADGDLDAALLALGTAMGRLHALPVPPGVDVEVCGAAAIEEAVAVLRAARPDVGGRARELADRLLRTQPAGGPSVWLHGDLNARNWLLNHPQPGAADRPVALFDFDATLRGPAGVDVGGVLAWMHTRTLLGAWTPRRESELVTALLRGYDGCAAPLSSDDRAWYRAAALLIQRAMRAVTRVREPQLAMLETMLTSATDSIRHLPVVRHV